MSGAMPDAKALDVSRFTRFVLSSGVAAFVNLASRWLINHYTSFQIAVAISFCFGVTTAYLLGRWFVFDETGRSMLDEFKRFLLVNLVALVLVWCISVGLAERLFPWIGLTWHAEDIAHLIGVLSPAVLSYFAHKSFTFARA